MEINDEAKSGNKLPQPAGSGASATNGNAQDSQSVTDADTQRERQPDEVSEKRDSTQNSPVSERS